MDARINKKNAAGTTERRKKSRSNARDPMRPRVNKAPPEPTYPPGPETGLLRDEQQVARVEMLMTRGVRDKRQLMQHLDVDDPRQMERYIKRVEARWELLGQSQDLARHRGEGLARLDLIERTLWARVQQRGPDGTAASLEDYLRFADAVLHVQEQRNELLGLTPAAVERLVNSEPTLNFSRSKAAHEQVAKVAARILELIEENLEPDPGPHDAD